MYLCLKEYFSDCIYRFLSSIGHSLYYRIYYFAREVLGSYFASYFLSFIRKLNPEFPKFDLVKVWLPQMYKPWHKIAKIVK